MKKVLISLFMMIFCIFICNISDAAVHWSELCEYKRPVNTAKCPTHGANCVMYLVTCRPGGGGDLFSHWMHIIGTTNKRGSVGNPTRADDQTSPWLGNATDPGVWCVAHDDAFAYNSDENRVRNHMYIEGTSALLTNYELDVKTNNIFYNNYVPYAAQMAYILSKTTSNGTYEHPLEKIQPNYQMYALWMTVGSFENALEKVGMGAFDMKVLTHNETWLANQLNKGDQTVAKHKQNIMDLYYTSKQYTQFMENRIDPIEHELGQYTETIIDNRKICGPFKIQYSAGSYGDEKFAGIDLEGCIANMDDDLKDYDGKTWYFCDKDGNKLSDGPKSMKQFYISVKKSSVFDAVTISYKYLNCYASYYDVRNQSGKQEHIYVIEAGSEWEYQELTLWRKLTWLDIIKVDKTTQKPMEGVKFIVQRVRDGAYIKETKSGDITYVQNEKDATLWETDSEGMIGIGYIEIGKYKIIEKGTSINGNKEVLEYNDKVYDCITADVDLKYGENYYKPVWEIIKNKFNNKKYNGFYEKVFEMLVTNNDLVQRKFYTDGYSPGIPLDMDVVLSMPEDYMDLAKSLRKENWNGYKKRFG